MRWFKFVILFAACCACSSPTIYEAKKSKYGFTDEIIDPHLRKVTFLANSATKKEDAALYAKYRAIELCLESNTPYAHIVSVRDNTFHEQSTQAAYYYPTAYYGASPYYGRYNTYDFGPATTQTYTETHTYPKFDVYFECVARPMDARMSFIVLSPSLMKDLVKDVKGGVQVENILPDSPNKGQLKQADIIVSLNGTRVGTVQELFQASRNVKGNQIWVEFFRDGVKRRTNIKFLDVTEMVAEAQSAIRKDACKKYEIKKTSSYCKD